MSNTAPTPKPWDEPYGIPAHVNVADAIRAMAAKCLPGLPVAADSTDVETTASWTFGLAVPNSPWDDMADLAFQHGLILGFSPNTGEVTLAEEPVITEDDIDALIEKLLEGQ